MLICPHPLRRIRNGPRGESDVHVAIRLLPLPAPVALEPTPLTGNLGTIGGLVLSRGDREESFLPLFSVWSCPSVPAPVALAPVPASKPVFQRGDPRIPVALELASPLADSPRWGSASSGNDGALSELGLLTEGTRLGVELDCFEGFVILLSTTMRGAPVALVLRAGLGFVA